MPRLPTAAALAASCLLATRAAAQSAPAGGTGHAAALLPDRSIVVTGGDGAGDIPSSGAFMYTAGADGTTALGSMALPRARHTATPLSSGLVVVIGGHDGYGGMESIEVFDPATNAFRTSRAVLGAPREGHEAIGLGGTRILIRGGRDRDAQVTLDEVYDWATDAVEPAPAGLTVATIATDRTEYLPGDVVLISGSGWAPGENVDLLFDEEPLLHAPAVFSTVADANGEIRDYATYHVDDGDLGTQFTLHAVGATSGLTATARFSDGAKLVIETAVASPGVVWVGQPFTVSVSVRNQGQGNPRDPRPAFNDVAVSLEVPAGWTVPAPQVIPVLNTDTLATVTFTLVAQPIATGSVKANASAAYAGSFACGTPGISCVASNKPVQLTVLLDTTPPAIVTPGPLIAEATGPAGAAVAYAVSASDLVDGPVAASCSPSSGSTFAIGTTTVSCAATDAAGNTAEASFTVTVQDTTAPVLSLPADLLAEATGPAGAAVSYAATASDVVDGPSTPACTPPPGSTFPLGTTAVSCAATDAAGNTAEASFTVTVQDTTPPALPPLADVAAVATAAGGALVSWDPIVATDLVDGNVLARCSPAPSSWFAPGTTTVSCTATDSRGNASAPTTFRVLVTFAWSDYLQPINVDGSSAWKLGRTVPVKFRLSGASTGITNLVATVSVARIADVAIGVTGETVFANAPDTGVTFRYDATGDQYVYNLRTGAGAMVDSTGTWLIRADLGDGVAHDVFVSFVR